MLWKRALLVGILVYLATTIVGLIAIMIHSYFVASPTPLPFSIQILSSLTALLTISAGAWWYFRSPATRSFEMGALLGIIQLGIEVFADIVILTIKMKSFVAALHILSSFYFGKLFLCTILLIILIPGFIGKLLQKRDYV